MNIKRVLLAFTLALNALIVSPAHAISSAEYMALAKGHRASLGGSPEEKTNKLDQAKSALKTFKKDIKCVFSREGCTREQKIRLAKQGLGLLIIIAALGGGGWLAWKSRVKKRAKAAAKFKDEQGEKTRLARAELRKKELAAEEKQEERERLKREQQLEREQEEAARLAQKQRDAIIRLEGVRGEKEQAVKNARQERDAAQAALTAKKNFLRSSGEIIQIGSFKWKSKTENERTALKAAQTKLDSALAERAEAQAALERAHKGQ